MKRLTALLLCLALVLSCCSALAETPATISTIPYDEIPANIDGQHHYLLLCTDVWHGNPNNLGNTDGIVMVTLDTRTHRIMLTSIIREALVAFPDSTETRHNYNWITMVAKRYSPEDLCKVISTHLGIKVEKYIIFDFSKIQSIIDYMGGVDITITAEEAAYLMRYAISPTSTTPRVTGQGTYHFGGHAAVIYMRIRKVGGGGDFMRTQRVRTVLSTLADSCRNITYEEATAMVDAVMDNTLLTNMNMDDMMEAMNYCFELKECTIEELRIPVEGTAHSINYKGASQEVDWAANREALADYLQNSFLVYDDEE